MLNENQKVLLSLVKAALWNTAECLPAVNWDEVEKLAQEQGVLWMAYLGAKRCQHNIPQDRMKTWRSVTHSGVLYNDKTNAVQEKLLEDICDANIPVAILKGTSCSRYYPYPDTRPLGDIDLLIDKENLDIVDKYLREHGYAASNNEHDFHVGYYGEETVIEVHFAGTTVPDSTGGHAVLDEMNSFLEHVEMAAIGEMSFPVLSDAHHALMLLLHMERHMMVGGIGLRQICDWATFVNGSAAGHWSSGTLGLLKKCGLLVYAKVITKMCVDYLGLDLNKAQWCADVDAQLTSAMISEVYRGGNLGAADQEGVGSIFVERSQLGKGVPKKLTGIISKLTVLAYANYPCAKKHKVLLPLLWIYIPVRYLFRTFTGQRPKRNISHIVNKSLQRQKLYKALRLYEV